MCKFESGLTSKKCKLFLGRVTELTTSESCSYKAHANHYKKNECLLIIKTCIKGKF